jgi:hypothetical protein
MPQFTVSRNERSTINFSNKLKKSNKSNYNKIFIANKQNSSLKNKPLTILA